MISENGTTGHYIRDDIAMKAAKEWATKVKGWHGEVGGWIYTDRGTSICQGWWNLWSLYRSSILDHYTATLTGFDTFTDLLRAPKTYRPTIRFNPDNPKDWRYRLLASAYNYRNERTGDPRRAHAPDVDRYRAHSPHS